MPLDRLIGHGPIEVGKSILIVFLAMIAAIALQQVAATRSSQTAGESDRTAVLALSRDFGRALTTYDYAHPEVQRGQLARLATSGVVDKASQSFPDLRLHRAVSIGQTPDTYLQSMDGEHAQVLVQTKSTLQSAYIPPGTRASGLLLCDLERSSSGWRVSGYQWLTPVAEGVG